MNSSVVIILKFLYSLKTWPHKLLVLFFFPLLCASLMYAFLTLRSSVHISSAKLELVSQNQGKQKTSNDLSQEEIYLTQANLSQQLSLQLHDNRILYVLGCRLSAYDLERLDNPADFMAKLDIESEEVFKHLKVRLTQVALLGNDSLIGLELERLIHISLIELENETSTLKDKVHIQQVPGSSSVLLKSYDHSQERANFIVRTLCELAVDYQKDIGFNENFPIIEAQKALISNRRDSWEASKERIRIEKETINAGRGPDPIQEISRKIFALKHSLLDVENRIIQLRKKMQKKREEEKSSYKIISVRNNPYDQESLILDLSKNLNELRLINAELKLLQDKLRKYKKLHLNGLLDQEKSNRKSLLEAQLYLEELRTKNAASLNEVRIIESAKTIPVSMNSLWILTAFSFFAGMALWLIFLLRIRYFR